jgi:hypothetical protein
MAVKNIVTVGNLGKTIKAEHLESLKYDVNIDEVTIIADANGILSAKGGEVITPTVVTGHEIATILDSVTGISKSLQETIIQVVDATNTLTITPEDGTAIIAKKIDTVVNTVDNTAKTLTTTVNGVASNAVDISALYLDVNVDKVEWTPSTYILKLTETDGTEFTIDLSALVGITKEDSTSVTLTGEGSATAPLKAEVILDPLTSNLAKNTGTGILVDLADIKDKLELDTEVQDAFGELLFFGNSTAKFA